MWLIVATAVVLSVIILICMLVVFFAKHFSPKYMANSSNTFMLVVKVLAIWFVSLESRTSFARSSPKRSSEFGGCLHYKSFETLVVRQALLPLAA